MIKEEHPGLLQSNLTEIKEKMNVKKNDFVMLFNVKC